MKKKYRMVKVTTVTGFSMWNIEKRTLLCWNFVNGYSDEEKARTALFRLRAGMPLETREVLPV